MLGFFLLTGYSANQACTLLLQGLGPIIGVLIAVHVAALLFWIFSLIRSSMSQRPRKADIKQH